MKVTFEEDVAIDIVEMIGEKAQEELVAICMEASEGMAVSKFLTGNVSGTSATEEGHSF